MFKSLLLTLPQQIGLLEGFSSGLIALANYVREHEPQLPVKLLDVGPLDTDHARLEVQSALATLPAPALVGITTTTATYRAALAVAAQVKAESPQAKVVLGGHHVSSQAEIVARRHTQIVDFVIRGEGERALLALLRNYPDCTQVPSLSYYEDRHYFENPPATPLTEAELDLLPPTFEGHGLRSAPGKFDHATYVSARGCPLRCSFCAVANDRTRSRSIPKIVADIRDLVVEQGYRRIAIEDNFFAQSTSRTLALCRALRDLRRELQETNHTDFSWDCQTRVESMVRPEIVAAMEEAGCEAVYLGVESLAPGQLVYLGKTRKPENYLSMLEHVVVPQLVASHIGCYLNLQCGLPRESLAEQQETLATLTRLGAVAGAHGREITLFPMLHVVYPGTAHFAQAVRDKRFGPYGEAIFERFTQWEAEQQPVLEWLGESFAHGTGGIPEGILEAEALRRSEFKVDPHAVLRVNNFLARLAAVPHLKVFKYGDYLMRKRPPSLGHRAVRWSLQRKEQR